MMYLYIKFQKRILSFVYIDSILTVALQSSYYNQHLFPYKWNITRKLDDYIYVYIYLMVTFFSLGFIEFGTITLLSLRLKFLRLMW